MLRPLRPLRIALPVVALVAGLTSVLTSVLNSVLTSPARAHEPSAVPIADLTRQIAASPDSLPLYLLRGELRRTIGDFGGALADYAQVERLNPRHPQLEICRSALALDIGDPAEARRRLDAVLAAGPDAIEALELRARAGVALGERRAAIADQSAVIARVDRPSPALYLERARLQVAEGDRQAARIGLDQARARIGAAVSLELYALELDLEEGAVADARARFDALASQAGVSRAGDGSALAGLEARIAAAEARIDWRGGGDALPRARGVTPSPPPQVMPAGVAATTQLTPVLPRHSLWKYDTTGTDLGTAWRQPAYSDSAWASGIGILGYGEPYVATAVPSGPDSLTRYPTTYFRIRFEMPDPLPTILSLTLTAQYDDGFVVYLNGVEAARRAISGTGYTTLATTHEAGAYEIVDLSGARLALVPGTNLLAVEVHQAALDSPDLVWDADLTWSNLPHLTRGPYLQMATDSAVSVRWRTSAPTTERVVFGLSPEALTGAVTTVSMTTEHELRLTGLEPATRYYYAVGTSGDVLAGGDSSFTFRTAPRDAVAAPVRVWVVGDSGAPGPIVSGVRDAYTEWTGSHETDLWLMLGDNAYLSGTDSEYQSAVFDPFQARLRSCPLWPTRGNHDMLHHGANNDYYDIFTMPSTAEAGGMVSGTEAYYSFNWSDIHFICLDSEGSDKSPGGAMMTWLAGDLAANYRPWVIAYWHHPPYSKGSHDSDTELGLIEMRQNALPILEAGGVDLVLCGHSHSYERSFLLNGHYGLSTTLTPDMIMDSGDGRPGGSGAYAKPNNGPWPHAGAVYAVSGSAAQTSGGSLNHPVMVTSLNLAGSMVLDIQGNQMMARFLGQTGAVLDSFAIVKNVTAGTGPSTAPGVRLAPGFPNPFERDVMLSYVLDRAGPVRLSICDPAGRKVAVVEKGWHEAGGHEVRWDGRNAEGLVMPNGVYLAVLEALGKRVSRKIALVR
jgi:tetratricopeptide (TPR) repeat protein